MPAQPLTPEQLEDAGRLKSLFRSWQASRAAQNLDRSQEFAADQLGFGQSALSQYLNGKIPLNAEAAWKFSALLGQPVEEFSPVIARDIARMVSSAGIDTSLPALQAPAPHEAPSDEPGAPPDLVITEYATGGGMDTKGQLLLDDQPGIIKSWRVTQEWLRLNVPTHTGLRNLCIVTGFGPSMRPMFNPGDPLLVDTGVKVVNHEGVYFFRVGEEGFIKLIQRVPEFDGPGFSLRIISKNPDYPPYDISPRNPHFEVLGKVLTVWRSEQY